MREKPKPAHAPPEAFPERSVAEGEAAEEGVVNDSLGTVDLADSTGLDEDRETGEAKAWNKDTKED